MAAPSSFESTPGLALDDNCSIPPMLDSDQSASVASDSVGHNQFDGPGNFFFPPYRIFSDISIVEVLDQDHGPTFVVDRVCFCFAP